MKEVEDFKAGVAQVLREALTGLAKSGAKATARAVDSVLEDVADRADEFVERVKKGRAVAQKHGSREARKVKIDSRVIHDAVEDGED